MSGYVVTVGYEVSGDETPRGRDVMAGWWGIGHEFSYCDGRLLTLVVEVTADSPEQAFESVLSTAESIWSTLTGSSLPAPTTMRVQATAEQQKVLAGAVSRGPDRVLAEAVAGRAARLRAAVAALGELERRA